MGRAGPGAPDTGADGELGVPQGESELGRRGIHIWGWGPQMSMYAGTEGHHGAAAGGRQSRPGDKSVGALMGLTLLWEPLEQGRDRRRGEPPREKGRLRPLAFVYPAIDHSGNR